MPVVAYYLGRPARTWIAAMSGPGNGRELVRRDIPGQRDIRGQTATRGADRPAKDTGGRQSPAATAASASA